MKKIIQMLLFFLLTGQIKAQTSAVPVVAVTYDLETTTYKQVAATTNMSLLTDFEKLEFKTRKVTQKVEKVLDNQNNIKTTITNIGKSGFENISEGSTKKIVIDQNGTTSLDAQNQVVGFQAASAKQIQAKNLVKQNITPATFENIPDFVLPSAQTIQQFQANGFQVILSPTKFTIKNATTEFTHDATNKLLENKVFKNNALTEIKQVYYTIDSQGKKAPSLQLEKKYSTSSAGVVVESVKIEKITNYLRITN